MTQKRINQIISLLLLLAAVVFLLPEGKRLWADWQNARDIAAFQAMAVPATQSSVPTVSQPETAPAPSGPYDRLLEEMARYNEKIYQEDQAGLSDAWDAQDKDFDFQLLEELDNQLGYLTIDAMDLKIPLYMGASRENLAKGAAVLSQTSLPVGGVNTNCVIAGHRGYYGATMFANIEMLQPGDTVVVTNLWEDLTYMVEKCIVISPDEIDAIKIVDGQDMLTLVTCHPYGHNYQRYVVYCIRETTPETGMTADLPPSPEADASVLPSGEAYQLSQSAVERDFLLNRIGAAVALLLLAGVVLRRRRSGKTKS